MRESDKNRKFKEYDTLLPAPLQKSCMVVGSLLLLKIIPTEIFLTGKFLKKFRKKLNSSIQGKQRKS